MSESSSSTKQKFYTKPAFIFFVICLLVAGLVGLTYYFAKVSPFDSTTSSSPEEDVKKTVALVGKLMQLPTDETPTIATVSDITKLAGQPFFSSAQNGDRVLIYNTKKQAILYRPSTNKIIEVAPVNVAQTTPTATASAEMQITMTPSADKPTFALYNGTKTAGLAKSYERELISKITGANVLTRANTVGDFSESVLIDVKGDKSNEASAFAKTLGISVSTMPEEESTPSADFLIILGTDKTTSSPTTSPTP